MDRLPELIDNLIAARRSVYPRDYTGERVDDALIRRMLQNANWAPNHKQTEPWRFVIYTGDGLKTLGEQQSRLYRQHAEMQGNFSQEEYQKLLTKPLSASHIIAIGMTRDPQGFVPEIEEIGAVFCAIQNLYLSAHAYGLACYLGTGGVTYYKESAPLFGFDRFIGFLYIGIPRPNLGLKGRRRPVEEKISWVTR